METEQGTLAEIVKYVIIDYYYYHYSLLLLQSYQSSVLLTKGDAMCFVVI